MNKKGMKIFRIVIGAYLTLIGITLFTDVYSQKPTNQVLLLLCAIALIVAGIACIVQSVRKMFNIFKVEKENRDEVEKKAEQERRHKELHSSDKFRTAPMPKAESHENITSAGGFNISLSKSVALIWKKKIIYKLT